MLLLALLACRAEIAGTVLDDAGAPVPGARLTSAEADGGTCEAVTTTDGSFRTRCGRGAWTFEVTHPDHLPGRWEVPADAAEVPAGTFTLVAVPTGSGAWITDGVRFEPLGAAHLQRRSTAESQSWCLRADAQPLVVGPGARLLRNEPPAGAVPADAERWRLYRVREQAEDAPATAPTTPGVTTAAATAATTKPTASAPPTEATAPTAPSATPTTEGTAPTAPSATPTAEATAPTTPARCAYRLDKGSADHWAFAADRVPLEGEGAARLWTDLGTLPPGDYVLAPWMGSMFVREDVREDTWRGTWIRVPTP